MDKSESKENWKMLLNKLKNYIAIDETIRKAGKQSLHRNHPLTAKEYQKKNKQCALFGE